MSVLVSILSDHKRCVQNFALENLLIFFFVISNQMEAVVIQRSVEYMPFKKDFRMIPARDPRTQLLNYQNSSALGKKKYAITLIFCFIAS